MGLFKTNAQHGFAANDSRYLTDLFFCPLDNLLSQGNGFANLIFAKRISIVWISRLYSKWAKSLHFIWSERPHNRMLLNENDQFLLNHAFSGSESRALREPL